MASKSKSKAKATAAASAVNELLKNIVAATLQGSFVYHNAESVAPLVSEGLVEQNPAMNDGQGGIATRATKKGIDSMNQQNQASGSAPADTSTDTGTEAAEEQAGNGGGFEFTIDDNVPMPAITGRGRQPGATLYPFERLVKVGQSFFVPKAAKNLASTISGANAKHSEPVVNPATGQPLMTKNRKGTDVQVRRQLRQFKIKSVTENGVKGSRIWRVEPDNKHVDEALKAASQPAATPAPAQAPAVAGQAWGQ